MIRRYLALSIWAAFICSAPLFIACDDDDEVKNSNNIFGQGEGEKPDDDNTTDNNSHGTIGVGVGRTDIMLQGFYWDSQKETGWDYLMQQAPEIGKYYTCVWLPPSSAASANPVTGDTNVGYHPMIWNNQNSCWGSQSSLMALNQLLHKNGVKVIADIVINHRAGYTDWCNFSPDDFGEYGSFQLTGEHICSGDETNTDHKKGEATGAADTGENWGGARDLDMTSEYVQKDITAYLLWLKNYIGYDGWRYDFCKGYSGYYNYIFNKASEPYLSVGEYWDGNYDLVAKWIDDTYKQSMAFDFPAKYAIFNNGLAKGAFASMTWKEDNTTARPAGMIHHQTYRPYSVTFVDNHDSYRDDNKYTGDIPQAYAILLASPGIPCVFWPHWTSNKEIIKSQIETRQKLGIGAESDCVVTVASGYYESVTTGEKGKLICRVGTQAPSDAPQGYSLADSGKGWYYFTSDNL